MRFLPEAECYRRIDPCLGYLRELPDVPAGGPPLPVHFFWRGRFGAKQSLGLKSFLATQDLAATPAVLWLDDPAEFDRAPDNPHLAPWLPHLSLRLFTLAEAVRDTPFAGAAWLREAAGSVAIADIARLAILHRHGGIYSDLDAIFLRPLAALHRLTGAAEFVFQWSALPRGTHAFCRFDAHSPAITTLIERANAARSAHCAAVLDFAAPIPELLVLPAPFFSPLWLQVDRHDATAAAPFRRFADFFRGFGWWFHRDSRIAGPANLFPGAFTYHWHGLWRAREHRDSYAGLLDAAFNTALREKYPAIGPLPAFGSSA